MVYSRLIIYLFFIVGFLNAQTPKDIVYVEDLSSKQIMLKDEFLKSNSDSYTLVLSKLEKTDDPIEFFRRYKLTNAIAYKYGPQKESYRVLSGVYPNYIEAKKAIKELPDSLFRFKPFYSKISRHQKIYNKNYNIKKITVNNTKSTSIIVSDSEDSKELKEELLKKGSKYYSISLASFNFTNENNIQKFFKYNDISDKAVAHLYGKDKNGVRVVYGLYNSYDEAKEAIKQLSKRLKDNSPFVQKVTTMQHFYQKYNDIEDNNSVIKFDENKKDVETEIVENKPKIIDDIKIIKKIEPPVTKRVLKVEKEVKKEQIVKKEAKIEKEKKPIEKKVKFIKDELLKHSKNKDVYFVEPEGSLNIVNEVFLNEDSSFYTIDLGEIKVEDIPLDKVIIQYNITNNALAYKYGKEKEFAKIVYGAFETKTQAQEKVDELNNLGFKNNIKVSNIKEHQELYKQYHEDIIQEGKDEKVVEKKEINSVSQDNDFLYVKDENKLKDAFLDKESNLYTITLITFHKSDINLGEFLEKNNLNSDIVAYSLGSQNNYYRVFYGAFETSKKTLEVIENLPYDLKKNKPYVSKVITNIRRFESYNNRDILTAIKNGKIIE
jgi:septal ring-binding cell division protein DamX